MITTEAPVPNNKSDSEISDLSTIPVPPNARMSKGALTMAWWSMCSQIFMLIIGATLASHYGARNALIGMAIAVVVFSAISYVFSRYAIRTGFSVALLSRTVFGRAGAVIATLIFAATNIYYGVFESSVVALALNQLVPKIPFAVAALIVVIYSVVLMFGKIQQWFDKLNGILLPFYIIGLIGTLVMATSHYGYNAHWLDLGPKGEFPKSGWWDCFAYYMGACALFMAATDFARFGREEDMEYHSKFNFGFPFWLMTIVVNGAAGIYLVATIPTGAQISEISVVFALLALMGIWGFVFIWITQTRINSASYFLGIVNTHAFFSQAFRLNLPRLFWVIAVGVIVYLLMLSDIFSHLLLALAYQGVFIVAWVGVVLSQVLMHPTAVPDLSKAPLVNYPATLAWLAATVVGLVLMNMPDLKGWSAPLTFVCAIIVHRVLSAIMRPSDTLQSTRMPT